MNHQSSHKQLLFLLPISFQSVSFHHKSKYYVQFTPLSPALPLKAQLATKHHSPPPRHYQDRNGNTFNVGSNISQKAYRTNRYIWVDPGRFEIEYNDQQIYFHTALMAQLNAREQITMRIELVRYQDVEGAGENRKPLEPPKQSVVASQQFVINTGRTRERLTINHFNYRRILFATSEYISSLDFAYHLASLGATHLHSPSRNPYYQDQNKTALEPERSSSCGICCHKQEGQRSLDPAQEIEHLYQTTVTRKLEVYRSLKVKLEELIKQYFTYIHEANPSRRTSEDIAFQTEYVMPDVTDLDYIALDPLVKPAKLTQVMEIPLQPSPDRTPSQLTQEDTGKPMNTDPHQQLETHQLSFIMRLCNHYECDPQEISEHLSEESQLLDINIRSLFYRLTQLQFSLAPFSTRLITENQNKRTLTFIFESSLLMKRQDSNMSFFLSSQQQVTELYPKFKRVSQTILKQLSNYIKSEERQPLITTSNEPVQLKGKMLPLQQTVTIFIHGYKGSEYDLSKVKACMAVYLGMYHFYSLKELSGQDKTKGNLDSMGQIAANQLNEYLNRHPNFRYVNVVCFSMGGVIVRAMLPRLHDHRHKFNLLMTLASPHLGVRQVDSCLVRTGMMVMRRLGQIDAIKELNVEKNDTESRYLHDLSRGQGLEWFNSVILVGAVDDSYIPLYSSLVDYKGDNSMIQQMSLNLLKVLDSAVKCSVKLEYDEGVWDYITQRAAHISFLQEDCFIKTLVIRFKAYFVSAIRL